MLRYVCDAEIAGRGRELNEYVLGVSVFGRPVGYSPADDGCVRSRAYELRNRLRAYYEAEAPEEPIRIVIEKGGYCPRFERSTRRALTAVPGPEPSPLATVLEALWRPLIQGTAPLLIAFDVRLFFFAPAAGLVVRDYHANRPADVAASKRLEIFQRRMGAAELEANWDYADFGAVHAAFLLGRLLSGARPDIGLKHSPSLDWHDVWNSNVVFLGKPDLNPVIRSLLEGKDFRADEFGGVYNARPLPGEAHEYRSASTHGSGEKYALITRLRGPQPGRYLLLLCGAAAELMWALAEAVTNPGHAEELLTPLRTPSAGYPEEFQIVIRATFQSNVPVGIHYVTHHVMFTTS